MDLVHRCQAGDEHAFAALFDKYKNLVYKTAYLMLGDASAAEDALQEVFIQLHRSLSSFQPSKGALTTWLYRITVNYCLNQRRTWRLPTLPLGQAPGLSLPSPEGQLGEEETIQLALDRLSAKLKAAVILRYYWELSYAEIAQILGIPVGTVKSRLNQALNVLREELSEEIEAASCSKSLQREIAK
ncbi:MAG: sigma-70 family RNA polymerase sigma factor [Chloroflexi bacterium]|nr:sigma-70 family RNA polymerase sigma factor [Chloroflexota bacterium]